MQNIDPRALLLLREGLGATVKEKESDPGREKETGLEGGENSQVEIATPW